MKRTRTLKPAEFRSQLAKLDLTIQDFAELVGLSTSTVSMWGSTRHERATQVFPPWVRLLLAAWSANPELVPREAKEKR